jgi:hypothetical protein
MKCPSCSHEIAEGLAECPACGIILAKARRTVDRPIPQRPAVATRQAPITPASKSSATRLISILAIGLGGAGALIGGYWFVKIRPRIRAIENPYYDSGPTAGGTLKVRNESGSFDRKVELPGEPLGVASNGREIIIGNRNEPRGFIRLRSDGAERFLSEKVPVIETTYRQRVPFFTVAWNGKNYIGYTDGSWFQSSSKNVFTVHDPVTLRVLEHRGAPELLGCLAWDGRNYWAATRRNTADSGEPAYLYRLDENFNVVRKAESPDVGCQGLAWDGRFLWFADVFSDKLHVVDVSAAQPRVVHSAETPYSYLSGVLFDGSNVWVTEYDKKQMHRLSPQQRIAWSQPASTSQPTLASVAGIVPLTDAPPSDEPVELLREKLRSNDWGVRMHAEMELRKRGLPVDYDRDQNSFSKKPNDDCEVIDWSVELKDGRLRSTWHLWFGQQLFNRETSTQQGIFSMPLFTRYTITINTPNGEQIPKQFDAKPGDNIERDGDLGAVAARGKYRIDIFLHAQYITPTGTNQILNRSGSSLEVDH